MHIELRIRQILESPSDLSDKLNVLIQDAQKSSPNPEDLFIYLRFFFNSGFHQELLSLIAELLERRAQVPWDLLIEVLGQSDLVVSRSIKQGIEKGLRRQEAEKMIWATKALDEEFPEFEDYRVSLWESFKSAAEQRKAELLEKFEFLTNQRLDNEARQVLRILISNYPEDTNIKGLSAHFEEGRAREVLNEFIQSAEETITRTPSFTPQELEFLGSLRSAAKELVKKHSAHRVDVCLFFLFIDDYESALEIMDLERNLNFSEAWLKAELLRYARRFLEALEQVDEIASRFHNDPDTLMATIYFRAEIFGEMGKYSKAIELLESIAKVRPQYRSTSHLLQSFKLQGFRR